MTGDTQRRLFCFGLGYSAIRLARRMAGAGWVVTGTVRSAEKAASLQSTSLQAGGVAVVTFGDDRALSDVSALMAADAVLVSIPPDEAGTDPAFRLHGEDLAASGRLGWLGYLSTTGVYGDHQGAWVDETAETRPSSPRSERRLSAERAWLGLTSRGVPTHVYRLSGIYGPGRSAIESLRAGTARRVVKPGQVFSRIHVDDIAAALALSIDRPSPGAVYNLADDEPAASADVIAEAARLLGIAAPPEVPFDAADLSPMARSFYADNRRVAADRLKRELGWRPSHPSYREGLRAILAETG